MAETRLYSYSEFAKTKRPSAEIYGIFTALNSSLRIDADRFADYWQEHINESKTSIQLASELAGTKKAVIFGVGNCSDIPLFHLVDRSDRSTIVDIESEGVTKAVEALPGNLQAKVDIQIEDLTGEVAETTDNFSLLLSKSKNPTDYAQRVLESLPNIHPHVPDFGNDYDFVCSNLLDSQLPASFGIAFAILGNSRYPSARFDEDFLTIHGVRTNKTYLVNNFIHTLQQGHIDLLLDSARKPDGVIYLADTFNMAYLKRDPLSGLSYFIDEQGKPTARPHKIAISTLSPDIAMKLEEKVQHTQLQEWMWYKQPPMGKSTGRVFGVTSFTLITKAI